MNTEIKHSDFKTPEQIPEQRTYPGLMLLLAVACWLVIFGLWELGIKLSQFWR